MQASYVRAASERVDVVLDDNRLKRRKRALNNLLSDVHDCMSTVHEEAKIWAVSGHLRHRRRKYGNDIIFNPE